MADQGRGAIVLRQQPARSAAFQPFAIVKAFGRLRNVGFSTTGKRHDSRATSSRLPRLIAARVIDPTEAAC